jgi:hypothetical protein
VSAADKLYNLRTIQQDYQRGEPVFERFSAPEPKRENTLKYYRALHDVYTDDAVAADPRRARLTVPMGELLEWFRSEDLVSA